MKKFLALALILTLALSVSVFADLTTDRVVGDDPYTGTDYEDGWTLDEFNAAGVLNSNINITVTTGQVESRYAVDVEFETFAIAVTGGKMVWNVNTLQYESVGTVGSLDVTNRPINIYNYSDKPVYVTPVVVDNLDDTDHVTITASKTAKFEVPKAQVGARGSESFTVSVTSDDWDDVAEYYKNELGSGTGSVVIGTINLQITPN